ncbi:MAG: hypothetical protein R3B92_04075 [Patescibacteria group bacterium]|uniref:Uncharacterized protein n=1 Tax=candidate division WWE3 bacterium TaxID=2053526 RepID=A0A955ECV9_UNCKA|nr:hypothetical protein [candidate division WWE3 bacterium]
MLPEHVRDYIKSSKELEVEFNDIVAHLKTIGLTDKQLETAKEFYENPKEDVPVYTGVFERPKIEHGLDIVLDYSKQAIFGNMLVLFGTLLILGLIMVASLVTYTGLTLNNRLLEKKVANLVQAIPFTPKTPEYLLENVFNTHLYKPTGHFYSVLTINTTPIEKLYGSKLTNIVVNGQYDFSTEKDLKYSYTITAPNTEVYVRHINNDTYIALNEIPSALAEAFSVLDIQLELLKNKWVVIRNEDSLKPIEIDLYGTLHLNISPELFKAIEVNDEIRNGTYTHKMNLVLEKEQAKEVLSVLKNIYPESELLDLLNPNRIHIEAWVDSSSLALHELHIKIINTKGTNAKDKNIFLQAGLPITNDIVTHVETEPFEIDIQMKLEGIGDTADVFAPKESEESRDLFTKAIARIVNPSFKTNEFRHAFENIERIATALEIYYSTNQSYTTDINVLVEALAETGLAYDAVNFYDINISLLNSRDGVVVYSKVTDETNPTKPYYALVKKSDAKSVGSYYTRQELIDLGADIEQTN